MLFDEYILPNVDAKRSTFCLGEKSSRRIIKRMNNIMLFTPRYPPSSGGAATFYSTVTKTIGSDYNFYVVTSFRRGEPILSEQGNVVIYRVLPRWGHFPDLLRVALEILVLFLMAIYHTIFKDVQLIHSHASSFSVLGLSAGAILSKTPIIYDCRDEKFQPWIVKLGLNPYIFSCSPNIDDILTANGISRDRIVRVPVVNPEYVKEFRIEPDSTTESEIELIFVGELREKKGINILLRAFEALSTQHSNLHLTIVGEGPIQEDIKNWISNRCLSDSITMPGEVEHEKALELISNADILVLPSASEGLPRVVIEAMEIGTTVVTTPVGSIPEVIDSGRTGFLIDRSADSFRVTLSRLIENPELCENIAEHAQEQSDHPDWKDVNSIIRKTYERVSRENRSS